MRKTAFKTSKGFTLIELLVVIGVLGILAAGLVATIDPVEQIRKAQDSNVKNTTVEYLNALIRYYSTHNEWPWGSTDNGGDGCNSGSEPTGNVLTSITDCTSDLLDDKELKPAFTNANNLLERIYVSEDSNDVSVCFTPDSRAQQADASTKYNTSGEDGTSCISGGGASDCSWCAK